MRTVDLKWQNLSAGRGRVEKLEAELRNRWAPRIKEVRLSRFQKARAPWEVRQEPKRRQFETEHAAWRARREERARELDAQRGAWEKALLEERQRTMALAGRGGLAGLAVFVLVATVLAVLGAPATSFVVGLIAVLLIALVPALLGWRRLSDLRLNDPAFTHSEEPEPRFIPDEPEPQAGRRKPVAMDICRQWWKEVAYDPSAHAARSEPQYGDEGVEYFARYLVARLPDEYVAVREVLVARALDVDLLVLGPTGMWILEVKHWSGEIVCRRGKWGRRRRGGYEVNEKESDDNRPDAQWLREEHAVKRTLGRRLPDPGKLIPAISGGIVFTHPGVSWDIDDSCKSAYGDPKFWAKTIMSAPAVLELRAEEQLGVLDALLKWAQTLDEDLGRTSSCSVELAQGLFSKATAKARAYVEASS